MLKESHDSISWILSRTSYPRVIKEHMDDGMLNVLGIGNFHVEWHLARDLKTLKCMYNVSHGTSKHPCLYCMKIAKDVSKRYSNNKRKC